MASPPPGGGKTLRDDEPPHTRVRGGGLARSPCARCPKALPSPPLSHYHSSVASATLIPPSLVHSTLHHSGSGSLPLFPLFPPLPPTTPHLHAPTIRWPPRRADTGSLELQAKGRIRRQSSATCLAVRPSSPPSPLHYIPPFFAFDETPTRGRPLLTAATPTSTSTALPPPLPPH